jgi:hypothetical protein
MSSFNDAKQCLGLAFPHRFWAYMMKCSLLGGEKSLRVGKKMNRNKLQFFNMFLKIEMFMH